MRVCFLGTPAFAAAILEALIFDGSYELRVFSQPDKPVGRKAILTAPPVKLTAAAHGLPVFQFSRISDPDGVKAVIDFVPDLLVTAAFGQKLSDELLAVPRIDAVNVHASLLPKYRGASPIQSCLINGDAETGVSVMRMVSRMDAGAVFSSVSTPILPDETADALSVRLSELGAKLLLETLPRIADGTATATEQDESMVTTCRKLTRETGHIDFMCSAEQVKNLVLGTNSNPGAFADLSGTPLKIHRVRVVPADERGEYLPGQIYRSDDGAMRVACSVDAVELTEVQVAGGKRMDSKSFLRGHENAVGCTLV